MAEKRTYTTVQGDVLDHVVWKFYGENGVSQSPYVERVLELTTNYRLSDQPEVMPPGVEIDLPPMTVDAPAVRRLWDWTPASEGAA